ncbi:hypothetical protein D3C71_1528430 [compost metagenome]
MPGITLHGDLQRHISVSGAGNRPGKIGRSQGTEQDHKTFMQRFHQQQRSVNPGVAVVGKLCPYILSVRTGDRGFLGQPSFEPDISVHIIIGHMMDNLLDRPAAWTIWNQQLLISQASQRSPQVTGKSGDIRYTCGSGVRGRAILRRERTKGE